MPLLLCWVGVGVGVRPTGCFEGRGFCPTSLNLYVGEVVFLVELISLAA